MAAAPSLTELRRLFADPPPQARPMMRWWWFGPSPTRADIERDLTTMAAAGIGGVEVAYVYPLVEHPNRLGSEESLADLAYAADVAEGVGLRFDLTLGSGWSFGGPHVRPEHAAKRLRWDRREIGPAAFTLAGSQQAWPGDVLVGVYLGAGSVQEPPESWQPLAIAGDGSVDVPAGTGTRVVLTATAGLTGQNVKRAAAGAEGPVHDHYDAAAVAAHLAALGDRLVEAVGAQRIGSVFCDSLEVYEADWTPALPAEFAARRGYRPEAELPLLVSDGPEAGRFRADYYRTLSELYEERFLAPLADWAHGHGLALRVQSYGEPPATLSSYARVDGIEGEQWGWTGLPPTKWASSAAHLLGVPVVSSETWTWVHAPSFRATPLDLKGEAHEHFLLGINQLIGHGWPCSPRPARGLGWFFYASGAFDDRNTWWPAAPELMRYLTRLSWLLRQGEPIRDVLVYLPSTDAYATLGTETTLDLFKASRALVDPALTASLRRAGYDFALIDDDAIRAAEPTGELIVLLPGDVTLPSTSSAWLDRVVAAGGRVETVGPDDDAAALVRRSLPPDLALDPAGSDVGMVHRRIGGVDAYLVVNTGPLSLRHRVVPRTTRRRLEVWDAVDGSTVQVSDSGRVELTLEPYQSLVVLAHDEEGSPEPRAGRPVGGSTQPVTGPWHLHAADGRDLGPVALPHRWEEDARVGPDFSGTLGYRTDISAVPADGDVWLDLGEGTVSPPGPGGETGIEGHSYRVRLTPPVGEVVRVVVDDVPVAMLWAPPYTCELTGQLVGKRSATLRLEVSNTTANALAADDTVADWVADAERWHGRRFRMQALDRAREGLSSGLFTVPVLRIDEASTT
ncbi:MAG TPA: glycosyl hydrolase [Microlunatus sp.]|nr:glycosyl hydrolase [Microlunatus sp.]